MRQSVDEIKIEDDKTGYEDEHRRYEDPEYPLCYKALLFGYDHSVMNHEGRASVEGAIGYEAGLGNTPIIL